MNEQLAEVQVRFNKWVDERVGGYTATPAQSPSHAVSLSSRVDAIENAALNLERIIKEVTG